VHTGQNYDYELNQIFYDDLKIRSPDFYLNAAGSSASETIGNVIIESEKILKKLKPDCLLVYGDTNSCLSVIPAKKLKIPIFHMEAGNRSFDQRVPEELNRKIVDHLSDINMPLTEHARRYLIDEGLRPEMTIKTGSTMKEVLSKNWKKIEQSSVLEDLKIQEGNFFVVSAHREENVDLPDKIDLLLNSLNAIAEKYKKPIIFSVHPRTKSKLRRSKIKINKLIRFMKPLGFSDYIKLQITSLCVLSDSGTISEESSLLNFNGIMLRDAHERPESMDEATVIMAGLEKENVLRAISVAVSQSKKARASLSPVADYEATNVSKKVLRIILSYTPYINRVVWHKN